MRALVLVPVLTLDRARQTAPANGGHRPAPLPRASADRLDEAIGLAQAIDLDVAGGLVVPVPQPRPATLFGSGKVEEIKAEIEARETGLVIVDHAISPVQQRNLERAWNVKVIDRTGLILEIFGRRARTREGRLQVELAHLSYQKSRLVRSWTHLERQRGGGGFLGGPGERQLELDRRMLQDRIDALKKELEGVVRTRALHRAGRAKVPYPVVAIVGYTNAGKSTLFNRITGAGVMAKDQVFATLDPTMREVLLPSGRRIILSDTVGFISDLPTTLVAAFRATLEEVVGADLIAHVRDISRPDTDAQARDVEGVLHDLGIDPAAADSPVIEVWNKIDRLDPDAREELRNDAARADHTCILASAATGEGLPELLAAIDARLGAADNYLDIVIQPGQGRLLSWIHANAQVLDQASGDDGHIDLRVRIAAEKRGQLERQIKLAARKSPAAGGGTH
ncbi:MAG: GTPase HflX [Hyphomicrobium sp.]|uniref:GTPase HflX n=1 Tax=Hyphomicrobium sp. CS1BSMeth3 TaxID=1892844 RepID=UPI00086B7B96|nr:GTPase HflX [Hyphomicrobium sp. CS1BSMeth3]MBN9262196.1 GTPase HflX [Hyphomicrobium sp.]MBN9276183.1 GTPase HflX [Hyphomicrobium sp.]ODT30566.1 MAG: GTPase HflX [Hyphomicrobium sp. SCN 65-11]